MKKSNLLIFVFLLISFQCLSKENFGDDVQQTVIKNGVGLGSVIAAITSWEINLFYGLFYTVYLVGCMLSTLL